MAEIAGRCTILVSSCDGYRDLWQPFFELFFRYWPDCPFAVSLIANRRIYKSPRISTIMVGRDRGWASNMLKALALIQSPYILYLQDDYLLTGRVETSRIISLLDHAEAMGAGCLRLYPCPGPDADSDTHPDLGIIAQDARYRVSLQGAIWDKNVLRSLLVEGESAWEMETRGTQRAAGTGTLFLSIKRRPAAGGGGLDLPLPYFCTAVERGAWVPEAVAFCKSRGIAVDLRARRLRALVSRTLRTAKAVLKKCGTG